MNEIYPDKSGFIGNIDMFSPACDSGKFYPEILVMKCNLCKSWQQDCKCENPEYEK